MKKTILLFLAFALALSACTPSLPQSTEVPAPSADEVAQAVLAVCEEGSESPERLDDQLDSTGLTSYLSAFYGLSGDDWDDCAIYRVSASAEAFEIAVIRLTGAADSAAVLHGLEAYRQKRQGDFTGYAPDQAAIVENGCTVLSASGGYAALLICEDTDAARSAFLAALGQAAPDPTQQPTPTPAVYAGRIPYTDPHTDDMTIYDTSAILAAWDSGDSSALSDMDRTILSEARQVLGSVLSDGMSDYEKEKAVYAWVTSNLTYDEDHYDHMAEMDPNSYNPYGGLVNHKAVCLGFACTFQLLMDMADVECITVVGASYQSKENHAWNMVRLNGEWYCVDTTWDHGRSEPWWRYFNVTSDHMADTGHQWDYSAVPEAAAAGGGRD